MLCDRFVSSTLAYQVGEDLTADEVRAVAEVALGPCPRPGVTVILDMPVQDSIARVGPKRDRIEQRPLAYHETVRRNFRAQAEADPARYAVVDAARPIAEVHADVLTVAGLHDAPLFEGAR